MPTVYTYTVQSKKGSKETTTGQIEAVSREAALATLAKQQITPLSIHEAKKSTGLFGLGKSGGGKVKQDELVIFTRQLSAMISAGVPLLRSLSSLAEHATNPAFKNILQEVVADVQSGISFSEALGKHPRVFGDVYVNMTHAGETAGILDEILKRLASQQEKNGTIRKKVKSAMSYPIVLLGITVLAFFGLMIVIIPTIGNITSELGGPDAELPLLTRIMLGISDFIITFWYIIIPGLIGAGYSVMRYIRTPTGKKKYHRLILKIPSVGTIVKKIAVARFARTYSALVGAGVPVIEALHVTAGAIGNEVYTEAINSAITQIENGEQLSKVVAAREDLFPTILSQMLSVGEETGQTDVVLIKVADFYDEEVDVAIDSVSSIIEPVMILILGSMVGLVAASVMGPIAGISQNIQG